MCRTHFPSGADDPRPMLVRGADTVRESIRGRPSMLMSAHPRITQKSPSFRQSQHAFDADGSCYELRRVRASFRLRGRAMH